ncbi:MAG: D-alanyl-D-alanine carboxypeptidase [Oscillospiraceae bacterium]|nr:D-alanyl-D-alanine carboxypeptidase [Oscillospiraceae bacterium]
MKKRAIISIFLIILVLFSTLGCPVLAAAAPETDEEPFSVKAKAAMLVDMNNGRVIYEQNPDEKIYPASLTKIMTCLLVLENANLSDIVTVSESALADITGDSSTAGLQIGEQMTLENLLYCMMIVSGNETCNVAAEHVAGSVKDFVRMMNERAFELGCTSTHFVNPHGLHDEEHYTTARDLILIAQAALKSETFKQITNTPVFTLPATNLSEERILTTTNMLIYDSTSNGFYYRRASGIKTGYTTPAGRCVVSTAKDNGLYYLALVCGAETSLDEYGNILMESFPECIKLFNYGFDQFAYHTALSPLYPVTQIGVRNSASSEFVALAPLTEVKVLLPTDFDEKLLQVDIALTSDAVDAPVASGDSFGKADVYYKGELLGTTQLVAIADIAKSELSAAAAETSNYIQQNWWKWIVFLIVLAIAAFIGWLVYCHIRRQQQRREKMRQRRRTIERSEDGWL